MKTSLIVMCAAAILPIGAYADALDTSQEPLVLSAAQMDELTAAGFVCPVFNSDAVGAHNPNAVQIGGGDYSIIGPTVNVPAHATNANGTGTPGGAHASPGDSDYTAIWN